MSTGKPAGPATPAVVDATQVPKVSGSKYPQQYAEAVQGRARAVLGNLFGLNQFGVNMVTLAPGSWSSHRHWHEGEDEFIYILEGEVLLTDDAGDHLMTAGQCAGFKAGNGNGHHLRNVGLKPVTYLEMGTRLQDDRAHYSDVDMQAVKAGGQFRFLRKDGSEF